MHPIDDGTAMHKLRRGRRNGLCRIAGIGQGPWVGQLILHKQVPKAEVARTRCAFVAEWVGRVRVCGGEDEGGVEVLLGQAFEDRPSQIQRGGIDLTDFFSNVPSNI